MGLTPDRVPELCLTASGQSSGWSLYAPQVWPSLGSGGPGSFPLASKGGGRVFLVVGSMCASGSSFGSGTQTLPAGVLASGLLFNVWPLGHAPIRNWTFRCGVAALLVAAQPPGLQH